MLAGLGHHLATSIYLQGFASRIVSGSSCTVRIRGATFPMQALQPSGAAAARQLNQRLAVYNADGQPQLKLLHRA